MMSRIFFNHGWTRTDADFVSGRNDANRRELNWPSFATFASKLIRIRFCNEARRQTLQPFNSATLQRFGAWLSALLLILASSPTAYAQRQMENLGRGVVAVRHTSTQVYVGWRMLGTDPDDIAFNLYRSSGAVTVKLNAALITASCNYVDTPPSLTMPLSYFVRPVVNGVEQSPSAVFTLPANAPVQQYLGIPLQRPSGGTTPDGVNYTYSANDCSVGDLDGDGEYEIIVKWDPSNAKDNSQSGYTGNVFLDAYKLDGTRLWRIDLGRNIRAGAHYTQFMVYDLDGNGRAEIACKTAPGTVDGQGNFVLLPGHSPSADYRNSSGYILSGPEYLTVFDGLTGAALATTNYLPGRGNVCDWGDCYGNRVDRFLAAVAYLDGVRPSLVMCRGYYTRSVLVAWDWRNGQLTHRWTFDSNTPGNGAYAGQGAHSLTVGDVDGDGKDEIVYGACTINDNGQGLYSTRLGHGDALHMSDMDPHRPGLEVWMVHESPSAYGLNGLELHDAATGRILFGVDGQGADIGRGVAFDIDPRFPGYECWGSRGGLHNVSGMQISTSRPGQMNFGIWWDADPLRELLNGTTIYKWNWTSSSSSTLLAPGGIASNNGTKATPALSADILGDWREEVVWRSSDSTELRIYISTIPATNRLYTLMHDPQYRVAIAWQNVAYNQPPHPGFFIGADMFPPPVAPISYADLVWRGGGANVWDAGATANWFTNGLWVSDTTAVPFINGKSVLFALSGSNHAAISLSGTLAPLAVKVHSARDYTFAGNGVLSGTMQLVKAGPARLALDNTNTFTGGSFVRGGALFVNGALVGSPVAVERRGSPEGPSVFGGGGQLGQGLTIQNGCVLVVGPNTNAPGTLTISNQLALLGARAHFDLSNDPAGAVRTNDLVEIVGNLTLSGTNTIEIRQLDGVLGGGIYPLFRYTGTLTGGLSNLVLSGNFNQPVDLTNPPGMIGLIASVPGAAPAAPSGLTATANGAFQINLGWTDNSADENEFVIERSIDSVNFVLVATVGANQTSYSDVGLEPSTTYYYRVRAGNLAGWSAYSNIADATTAPVSLLTWRGDGGFNVWDLATTSNWFDGSDLTIYGDGALVTFDNSGSNSPAINLTEPVKPGSLTVSATKNYTFSGVGALAGAMPLSKSGSGSLTINTSNSFSGGTVLSNGTVFLGNATANRTGLGVGTITFRGGALQFNGHTGSTSPDYGFNTNSLAVPADATGRLYLPSRFLNGSGNTAGPGLAGALTGAGTLDLFVSYVRGNISGDWTAFSGRVNVRPGAVTPYEFRLGNFGSPNGAIHLASGVVMYHILGNGRTIDIGELSGEAGATIGTGNGNSINPHWRVGARNTTATFAGRILDAGTTRITKVGAGAWTLAGTNAYTGVTTVSGGILLIDGDHSDATGTVTVDVGAALGGTGIIGGNTIVNGALAPGASGIGTLTFNGGLTLNAGGIAMFELSKLPFTNDVVRVLGMVTFGGTLSVANVNPELLEAGDTFRLFDAASYSGAFATINLPELENGLAWDMRDLHADGTLRVISTNPPVIADVSHSNGSLSFSGRSGTPGGTCYVLRSTNVSLPAAQWERVATNQFNGSGEFIHVEPIDAFLPQRFYLLQLP